MDDRKKFHSQAASQQQFKSVAFFVHRIVLVGPAIPLSYPWWLVRGWAYDDMYTGWREHMMMWTHDGANIWWQEHMAVVVRLTTGEFDHRSENEWNVKRKKMRKGSKACISRGIHRLPKVALEPATDRNFPCQTLKIRKVSLVVMGS
jgi:hypothetical protein